MAGASGSFHEAREDLSEGTVERHRAVVSLMEELEAVDWYDQRVDASRDASLAEILAHNRDEEKEHASMTLEWLRRHDATWDAMLRTYLFTDPRPVTEVEDDAEHGSGDGAGRAAEAGPAEGSLGIGSLRTAGGAA